MLKRLSRNFKAPLIYGGQWKDHQTFQKWDPISKRLVTVACCDAAPPSPPQPSPPPIPTEVFYRYFVGQSGQVKYATIIYNVPISLKISVLDTFSVDQTAFLQAMSMATTITLTSVANPSIYYVLTINSTTSDSNYWTYYYTLTSFTGSLIDNEQIKITYS